MAGIWGNIRSKVKNRSFRIVLQGRHFGMILDKCGWIP